MADRRDWPASRLTLARSCPIPAAGDARRFDRRVSNLEPQQARNHGNWRDASAKPCIRTLFQKSIVWRILPLRRTNERSPLQLALLNCYGAAIFCVGKALYCGHTARALLKTERDLAIVFRRCKLGRMRTTHCLVVSSGLRPSPEKRNGLLRTALFDHNRFFGHQRICDEVYKDAGE